MTAYIGNTEINLDNLPLFLSNGGDINARYVQSEEGTSPLARGIYATVKYTAPLDRVYTEWGGRMTDALVQALSQWRDTLKTRTQVGFVYQHVNIGDTLSGRQLTAHQKSMATWYLRFNGLSSPPVLREALFSAALKTSSQALGVRVGTLVYQNEMVDLNKQTDAILAHLANQGLMSSRNMGNLMRFDAQVGEYQNRLHEINHAAQRFKNQQALSRQTDREQRGGSIAGLVGSVLGIIGGKT